MYANELSTAMIEDKRRSMRTSAIIHAILILLALLPFLRPDIPPKPYEQAILVEFDPPQEVGGSSEGSQQSGPKMREEAAAAEASEDMVEEPVEETRETKVKPVETTPSPPVLTSKTEPPVIKQTKVRKVDIKTPPKPTETIPQQTKVEEVPTPKKDPVLKPSKTKKVVIKIDIPSPKKGKGKTGGSSTTKSESTGNGQGKANEGGAGEGGTGSSKTGDGKNDGNGSGNEGQGDGKSGDGKGSGNGDGEGDGILRRTLLKTPDMTGIIKESGKLYFDVCVNRTGRVTFAEFNREYSTIKDMDVIRKALSYTKDYVFERDADAPTRECGRVGVIFILEDQ